MIRLCWSVISTEVPVWKPVSIMEVQVAVAPRSSLVCSRTMRCCRSCAPTGRAPPLKLHAAVVDDRERGDAWENRVVRPRGKPRRVHTHIPPMGIAAISASATTWIAPSRTRRC